MIDFNISDVIPTLEPEVCSEIDTLVAQAKSLISTATLDVWISVDTETKRVVKGLIDDPSQPWVRPHEANHADPGASDLVLAIHQSNALRGTIRIPLVFVYAGVPVQKFSLYHVLFLFDDPNMPASLTDQMGVGYYGVTKRGIWNRFSEHAKKAFSNTGFALHTAWHTCIKNNWRGLWILRLTRTAKTLQEIYELEEQYVRTSLLPDGLNVIPGGYAGIQMLHELRLANTRWLSPEQRDNLLEKLEQTERAGPAAHYRKGHIRKLPGERTTWVRACFVAMSPSELRRAA